MSYLDSSNHRLRTYMYVVTLCDARCVSREFGYTCSRSRSLRGRFVWHAPVRSLAGGFVPAGTAIADALSARLVIAKLAISLAPYCGSLVGAITWLSWILLYLAKPTYVQVRTCRDRQLVTTRMSSTTCWFVSDFYIPRLNPVFN